MQELKDHVEVPRPIFASRNVLIMTYLPGVAYVPCPSPPLHAHG